MTSVVIHIGQPKAASTSIQQQLWAHRETLAGADILYRPGQREQHGPEVLDLYFLSGRRPPGDAADRSVGGWDRLRREVRSAPRAIISAEMLSLCDAALAQRVVEDLSPCGRPRVLLCVRRPSAAVASAYSQLARVSLTVSFETWARLILAPEHRLPTRIPQLRNPDLVSVWEPFGDVVQVPLEHGDGAGFDAAVIEALGLSGIDLPRPFLQRHNTSPSAASVVAWQRLWRQGTPPLKFSRMPTVRNAIPAGGSPLFLMWRTSSTRLSRSRSTTRPNAGGHNVTWRVGCLMWRRSPRWVSNRTPSRRRLMCASRNTGGS